MIRNPIRARRTAALLLTLSAALAAAPAYSQPAPEPTVADEIAALRLAIASERARPPVPQLPRSTFLVRSQLLHATLSPNGRHLAWLQESGRQRSVWLQDTAGGAPRRVLAQTEAGELVWTRDGRWLLLPTPRQLFALGVAGQPGSGTIASLGEQRGKRRFLMVDPVQPAAVLLLERPDSAMGHAGLWQLWRRDVDGGETLLHADAARIVDVAIAADGSLAWLLRVDGEAHQLLHVGHDGAPAAEARATLRPVRRCERLERCLLLGVAPDGGVWMNTSLDGDRSRLARVDRDGRVHVLHEDPRGEADLADFVPDPIDGRPRFAGYRSARPQLHALEPADAAALASLRQAFPRRILTLEIASDPGNRWLVHERGDTLRGERLWLFDPAHGARQEVLADVGFAFAGREQARPDESRMAHKWPLRWRASDGRWLHGFVTLPPGVDVAHAPLMAAVHGGPFNLVRPDFSSDAQFLANRGYVVFQPNFRGSTGFGQDYLFSAKGDFGNGRVQRDIVEGVEWLLANGIGDRESVGISGASFGGYSALLGITFQPELFRIGIAAVPPVDFGWTVREYLGLGQEMVPGIPIAASMRHVSLDPADPAVATRLNQQSPMAHAAGLQRPLLMLAGGEDERVPIRGVTQYAAKLKTLGKDVSLFIDAQAGHNPDDTRTIEAYYFLTETLLHRHLGGAAPQPADRELRDHIKRNLRLAGNDLKDLLQGGSP